MIEVIYKEKKQEAKGNEALFSVPRNIRQVGLADENYRIYIEDYVYTFLGKLAETERQKTDSRGCAAVFTGELKWLSGTAYVFVRGALMTGDMEAAADHLVFTEEIWTRLYEEKDKYFPEQEIVGWFFADAQLPMEATEVFKRAHLKYFGGEKVLMLMNSQEKEDAFFRYENNLMLRQSGYYIYYEKNPLMQEYMLDKNHEVRLNEAEQVDDKVVKDFRRIIKGKKKEEQPETEEQPSVFSYAATACLLLAVLAVGAGFYKNYRSMEAADRQAAQVSKVIREETEAGTKKAVTPAPSKIPSVTPAPSVTPTSTPEPSLAQEEEDSQTSGQPAESDVYRQESDVRKAKRRETQEAQSGGETRESADEGRARDTAAQGQDTGEVQKENTDSGQSGTEAGNQQDAEAAIVQENQEASGGTIHNPYVIRPGDTLYQISIERYGDMAVIQEICKLNGISPEDIIYPGQIIVLP